MTDSAATPGAPAHLPFFITAPGQTDGLLIAMVVFLIVVVLSVGNLYFKLHALPEHRAHRTNKAQMEVVAVLALIALFTHDHIFWILALLLALVQLPDFSTPLNSIADSLDRLARGSRLGTPRPEDSGEPRALELEASLPPLAAASEQRALPGKVSDA